MDRGVRKVYWQGWIPPALSESTLGLQTRAVEVSGEDSKVSKCVTSSLSIIASVLVVDKRISRVGGINARFAQRVLHYALHVALTNEQKVGRLGRDYYYCVGH